MSCRIYYFTFTVSVDEEDALTADFNDKEENPWITEWTCKAFPLECDIQLRLGIYKQLCDIRHQFDVNQGVKLMNLCNTKQKVILAFGHDTKVNALNLITKFVDVRSTVLEFMQKVDRNVEDIKVSVRLRGQNQPEEQQGTGITHSCYIYYIMKNTQKQIDIYVLPENVFYK